ncbi:MAG: sortase [bacterium]|nr:sortase [bacterium]
MTEKRNENKKRPPKHVEPKISELEKWLADFRSAHGHNKLMLEIKKIVGEHDHKKTAPKKEASAPKEEQELKISDIEKIFHLFRQEHGHEKLKESLDSATQGSKKKPEQEAPKHVVYKTDPQTVRNDRTRKILKKIGKALLGSPKFIREKLKYKRYRYPVIATCVFLGIYLLFNLPLIYARISWKKPADTQKLIVKTQEVYQKKMADSATLAPGEVIPAESRIIIPKISANVPIVYAGTKDEKTIQNLLHSGVVHYQGTAMPGEVGNSFITGHSSNYWWDTGKYNQVFVMLDKLGPGDQAVVYNNGKKFVYTVRDKVVVAPEDVSVLSPTATPTLSLMTCTPPGTSWKRLVVRLDQTDPVYYAPETITKEDVVETPKAKKQKSFLDNIFSFFMPN